MAQPQPQMQAPEAPAARQTGPQPFVDSTRPPGSEKDPYGYPILPRLSSFASSICIPIEQDLAAPFTPPANRVARVRESIAILDAHSRAVQDNSLNLAARDAARIRQDARRWEDLDAAQGTQSEEVQLDLEADDLTNMIDNMEAPDDAFRDPYLHVIPAQDFPDARRTPREWAAYELFRSLEASAKHLEGYEDHVNKLRNQNQQALKRELEREAK
ncbi:hypothetical protein QQZ08_002878 [Neonectria magnoliae]|uniref:Uncharacterized protein n=1 Tax=Neonectria magnoliae TaxID=2732573 RepID=A0ABR1IAM1_9HYPO